MLFFVFLEFVFRVLLCSLLLEESCIAKTYAAKRNVSPFF